MSEPESTYFDRIKPLFEVVDIHTTFKSFQRSCSHVPRDLLIVYAAHFAMSEVHNGGFLQLFWNSTGILVPEAIEGFRAIGMPQLASVFTQATKLLGSGYPREREDRHDALLGASPKSAGDLEEIFATTDNFYIAYEKAVEGVGFDELNRRVWQLAKGEDGGFIERADAYLS